MNSHSLEGVIGIAGHLGDRGSGSYDLNDQVHDHFLLIHRSKKKKKEMSEEGLCLSCLQPLIAQNIRKFTSRTDDVNMKRF